jgi:hypothetical protein
MVTMSNRDLWRTQGLLRNPSPEEEAMVARDRAIRRVALFLNASVRTVEQNVPNALLRVLCKLPDGRALRRGQDKVLMKAVHLLFAEVEHDDPRRPRLNYLLESASWRSRI